jgi:hypothetical protein
MILCASCWFKGEYVIQSDHWRILAGGVSEKYPLIKNNNKKGSDPSKEVPFYLPLKMIKQGCDAETAAAILQP